MRKTYKLIGEKGQIIFLEILGLSTAPEVREIVKDMTHKVIRNDYPTLSFHEIDGKYLTVLALLRFATPDAMMIDMDIEEVDEKEFRITEEAYQKVRLSRNRDLIMEAIEKADDLYQNPDFWNDEIERLMDEREQWLSSD